MNNIISAIEEIILNEIVYRYNHRKSRTDFHVRAALVVMGLLPFDFQQAKMSLKR
ncbi:MAG: hypothetical protein IKJ41_08965 [Clostridia bacterium]|nr:hypothetical protein [Clostridia bacterium]